MLQEADNLDDIIRMINASDTNRYGNPPASDESIINLKRIESLTASDIDSFKQKGAHECVVCKEEFDHNHSIKEMPCAHIFHVDCLDPWLKTRNSCPVCRFELPAKEDKEN